ncbi:3-oxoacyl-[acyl-carrier-protein] synthase III C-terminal domain-containing protein [Streptomyces massasporeus]|uniref:3-oxoacyl-[acyl-carrier-protein] synthase III C-terminal domain-containing protein n=1 Tax=Streptomyces massasporeus TaxID=67324 RepID=UPI0034021C40
MPTFPHTGNVAAATLPLQLALASQHNRLHPGMTIALFGLASGASGAVMLFNCWTGETHQDVAGRGDCGRAQNMDTRWRAAGDVAGSPHLLMQSGDARTGRFTERRGTLAE